MHERVVEEGGEGSGLEVREQMGIPAGVNERRKYFQSEETRTGFEFEEGRAYWVDFGNPYLGFNGSFPSFFLSLSLPCFSVHVRDG